jgi:hypothetical protein
MPADIHPLRDVRTEIFAVAARIFPPYSHRLKSCEICSRRLRSGPDSQEIVFCSRLFKRSWRLLAVFHVKLSRAFLVRRSQPETS